MPRAFGPYTLFDVIGRGGMAEIALARATTELGGSRRVVVKRVLPELSRDVRFADLFVREAKLSALLTHANVVQVYDLGREGDELYIAMEYVEGFDLNALLRKCSQTSTPLPVEHALTIIADVLRGLDYAHRAKDDRGEGLGLVHRDLSPSNVLVSLEGEVKVCDFGIALAHSAAVDAGSATALDEVLQGKAGYMSPEHARGEAIDARADVFAAGILLWELLAGRRLYRAKADLPLLEQAKRAEIPELPARAIAEEPLLHGVVAKALSRDRGDRFASAGDMLRALEDFFMVSGMMPSPMRLRHWLTENFGTELIEARRARERALSVPPPAQREALDEPEAGGPDEETQRLRPAVLVAAGGKGSSVGESAPSDVAPRGDDAPGDEETARLMPATLVSVRDGAPPATTPREAAEVRGPADAASARSPEARSFAPRRAALVALAALLAALVVAWLLRGR